MSKGLRSRLSRLESRCGANRGSPRVVVSAIPLCELPHADEGRLSARRAAVDQPTRLAGCSDRTRRAASRPVRPGPISGSTIESSPPIVPLLPPTFCHSALRPMPPRCAGRRAMRSHSGDQDKADAIYRRYVANGAYQAWARDFGQICPAPDFEGARTFWKRPTASWATQIAVSALARRRACCWPPQCGADEPRGPVEAEAGHVGLGALSGSTVRPHAAASFSADAL